MKHLHFYINGVKYRLQITRSQTGSNYNRFAHLFNDKNILVAGTSFKDGSTDMQFVEWGVNKIAPDEKIDLLENYHLLPANVQKLLLKFKPGYTNAEKTTKELLAVGYSVECSLDGELCDLQPIKTK